ncbi:MAG: ATP-binding cassette domain-containing protein [Paludibacter sp.]|nr:ATP-binding cassette domain-containing protein [Paludibacter sp.]
MEKKLLIKYVDVDIYQQELLVLKDVQLEIHSGEFIYLLGKVGSGKSTLLKSIYHEIPILFGVAGALGYDLRALKANEVPYLRRKIGIVFQDFQLLTDRTVNQNLDFVLRATGWLDQVAIDEQIANVLQQVGMGTKGTKMPHQLSGGEQQRIVIARALLNSPEMILADEPTGNLDPETGRELVELLYNIRLSGTTVIMATHNLNWLNKFPGRVFRCENEQLTEVTNAVSIGKVVVTEAVVVEKLIDKPVSVQHTAGVIEQIIEEETV